MSQVGDSTYKVATSYVKDISEGSQEAWGWAWLILRASKGKLFKGATVPPHHISFFKGGNAWNCQNPSRE